MSSKDDTIAAVGTPIGEGGIGIIRISGPLAERIALRIFRPKTPTTDLLSHHLYYGHIIHPEDGSFIDEVLLTLMQKPKTYTREDILEINCHGGGLVLQKVLELALREGARLAEPGEFTRRAFLNGRIDLTQAEAVIDIIRSKTEKSLALAAEQLKGKMYDELEAIRERAVYVLSHLEAAIDFPEEEIEILNPAILTFHMDREIIGPLKTLIASHEAGRIYREGISTIIVGKPNVGKSSLLNVLLRENRAIVTPFPGTTRDTIEEFVSIKGIPIKIVDTAGISEPKDEIEAVSVKIAREKLANAELIIFMVDASDDLDETDLEIYTEIRNKPVIVALNKIDLVSENAITTHIRQFSEKPIVKTSAIYNTGIDELRETIFRLILGDKIDSSSSFLVTNIRHKLAIEKAINCFNQARVGLNNGASPELVAVDMQLALDHLGEVIGITTPEDVLEHIFSQFCIGK